MRLAQITAIAPVEI